MWRLSRASQEACELKFQLFIIKQSGDRRASQEACELKSQNICYTWIGFVVAPRKRRVS